MLAPLALTILLAQTAPAGVAALAEAGTVHSAAPSQPVAAAKPAFDALPATVFPAPQLLPAQGGSSVAGLLLGAGLLAALAAAVVWQSRKRRAQPRYIQVMDTASLGPKRSLTLVVVDGQSLLLSCSESGIALLSTQPASAAMLEASNQLPSLDVPMDETVDDTDLRPSPKGVDFNPHLVNAEEVQLLRRRLAQAGAIR